MRLLLFGGFLATVVCMITVGFSLAAVTDIQTTPPMLIGSQKSFRVVSNKAATKFGFQGRCTTNMVNGNWVPDPIAEQASDIFFINWQTVGDFDLRGWAYDPKSPPTMPPQYEWNSRIEQEVVQGPDTDEVVSGLNVNSVGSPTMVVETKQKFKSGTFDVNDQVGIVGGVEYQWRVAAWDNFDTGWVKDEDDDTVTWTGNRFVTSWQYTPPQNWNQIPSGTVFIDSLYRIRFRIRNCSGVDQYFPGVDRHLLFTKTGAATYSISETVP